MAKSSIEWTESTWNPVTGCTKISSGCKYCYAERMAIRLQAMGQSNYRNGFKVTLHERQLEAPLRWKKPQRIFVNSMSDLFHDAVPLPFIQKIFEVMRRAYWHQFQVLTKRSQRLADCAPELYWPSNVWMGVSVENQDYTFRIDHLRRTGANVKFLSLEPLIGPLPNLNLRGIDWVIVGGESGPKSRPMKESWVLDIRDQCDRARVPLFFKQTGRALSRELGLKSMKGSDPEELPEQFRIRQYPIAAPAYL